VIRTINSSNCSVNRSIRVQYIPHSPIAPETIYIPIDFIPFFTPCPLAVICQ